MDESKYMYTFDMNGNMNKWVRQIYGSSDWENEALYGLCDMATGITHIYQKALQAYPNPTKGRLMVNEVIKHIVIYDIYGKLVATTLFNNLDITHCSSGIYFLKATDKYGKVHTFKVVKE